MEKGEPPTTILYFDLAAKAPPPIKEALSRALSFIFGTDLSNLELEKITGGNFTSQLYRFTKDNEKFVLRIPNAKECVYPSAGLLNRKNEIKAHQAASRQGIAPRLIYVDPQFLVSVMLNISGHPLSQTDLEDRSKLENLAQQLKSLHSLPYDLSMRRSQLNRAITHYNKAKSKGVAFPTCFSELFNRFVYQEIEHPPADLSLTHGDLHPGNILITEDDCYFIDWAYASGDCCLTDIAYMALLSGMNDLQFRFFFDSYLERKPSENDWELFKKSRTQTCLLLATALFDLSGHGEDDTDPMKERIDRLNSMLESPDLKPVQSYLTEPDRIHPRKSPTLEVQRCALAFLKCIL